MSNKMALDALTAALDAMEHMANTLNNMDAVDEEEDAQHDAAFEAVRLAIAQLEQPQKSRIVAASMNSYPEADQRFFNFWYGHMFEDLMPPPLVGIDHATARYIWNAAEGAAIAALQAAPQSEHCVDVHALLREAADQKAARTEQLPTEQDCISMMVQCRLRLLELGWTSGEYAPKDGQNFEGINPGFTGPAEYTHLGSGFFIASPGDWWPAPRPLVFRLPTPPKD